MSDSRSALLKASTPIPKSLFEKLITANHILHAQNVVDAFGHISVRNPQNSATFFMSRRVAPAMVTGRDDIEEYSVDDANPVNKDSNLGYVERFIHSEIYKKFKGVECVVHAHSEAVLPFGISSVPLRPVFHLGSVIGTQVPVYDAALHYKSSDTHDLLISNQMLGTSLAAAFSPTTNLAKTGNLIKNYLISSTISTSSAPVDFPPHPVVLMRGHGFTAVGTSIEEAVYRAVYTVTNARVQTTALLMQGSYNVGLVAEHFGNWDGAKDGSGGGPKGQAKQEGLRYLSEKEVKDGSGIGKTGLERCWQLWCAEVHDRGLYCNELLEEDEGDEEGEAEE